ncbi:MAG: hypothetical protein AB8B80_06795 [Marinicellaceae bacterium]
MKLKSKIALIFIIGLIIFWYVFQDKKEISKPINEVKTVINESSTKNKKIKTPRDIFKELKQASKDRYQFLKEKQKKEEPDLTYLQAYRDMKFYRYCSQTFYAIKNDQDLKTIPIFNPRKNIEATDKQWHYHLDRIKKCQDIVDTDDEKYIAGNLRLRDRFKRTKPKTDNEKDLARVLLLVENLKNSRQNYNINQRGIPVNPELMNNYRKQIFQLNKQYYDIKGTLKKGINILGNRIVYTQEQEDLRSSLAEQIMDLEEKIKSNYKTNDALIINAELDLIDSKTKLTNAIKQVISPDAFLVIMDELMKKHKDRSGYQPVSRYARSEYVSKEKTMDEFEYIQELRNKNKLFDNKYYNKIMPSVIEMIACSLEYPCDDYADFIVNICLFFEDNSTGYRMNKDNEKASQACGQTVVDYLMNTVLTENQLVDVNALMATMMSDYE